MINQDDELIVCLCMTIDWLEGKVTKMAKASKIQEEAVMELKLEIVDSQSLDMKKRRILAQNKLGLIRAEMKKQKSNFEKNIAEMREKYKVLYSHYYQSNLQESVKTEKVLADNKIKEELFGNFNMQIEQLVKLHQRHCLILDYGTLKKHLEMEINPESSECTKPVFVAAN